MNPQSEEVRKKMSATRLVDILKKYHLDHGQSKEEANAFALTYLLAFVDRLYMTDPKVKQTIDRRIESMKRLKYEEKRHYD